MSEQFANFMRHVHENKNNERGLPVLDGKVRMALSRAQISRLCRGDYQVDCLFRGHVPGVLSGANLVGKAAKYKVHYDNSRQSLYGRVEEELGVESVLIMVKGTEGKRKCRVWAKRENNAWRRVEFDTQ